MGKIVRWGVLCVVMLSLPAQVLAVSFFISSDDILSGAVLTDKIAPAAVTSDKIATGAVTNDKIAVGTITQDKLAFTVGGGKYANVVIVAKSGGDFTDPLAAVNSITDASAANPYLVKIMPGLYDLGTASLQLKDYVYLEGSGQENTIITSSNANVDSTTCTVGTVLMANNSSVRHIKIVNNPPDQNGNYNTVAALVFNNVNAKAEGIAVLVGSDTVAGGQNNGICTYGDSADAGLNNVYVETHNNGLQSNAIITMGGKLTLTNSKLSSFNTENGSIDVLNDKSFTSPSTITITNSTIEGTRPGSIPGGIFVRNNKVSISNSTIKLNVGSENWAIAIYAFSDSDFSMVNSKIISDGTVYYYNVGNVKIANSLLQGNIDGLSSATLVNNYDENFIPISDQY